MASASCTFLQSSLVCVKVNELSKQLHIKNETIKHVSIAVSSADRVFPAHSQSFKVAEMQDGKVGDDKR